MYVWEGMSCLTRPWKELCFKSLESRSRDVVLPDRGFGEYLKRTAVRVGVGDVGGIYSTCTEYTVLYSRIRQCGFGSSSEGQP
jgi:hypothetical protein